jgi:uncharacterized protein YegL
MQNKIVHAAVVLDASGSMTRLSSKVEEVADRLIRDLKTQSEELDLETRVSVYTFSYHYQIKCLIFDKDVFRLPSIKGMYHASGQTALIDATLKSQNDLAATAQMYGEHSFITYVVTDGYENDSRNGQHVLSSLLAKQGQNWSVACLVPDKNARDYALSAGFASGNILIWDATSTAGLEKAAESVTRATKSYMTSVSAGVAIDKNNVFGTGVDKVNATTVNAHLVPFTKGSYQVWHVDSDIRIDLFVQSKGWTFNVGKGYYQLTGKSVLVQANKKILVLEKSTHKVYGGAEARALVGLSQGVDARVKADANPDYIVLAQSTANNRKLLADTTFVYVA